MVTQATGVGGGGTAHHSPRVAREMKALGTSIDADFNLGDAVKELIDSVKEKMKILVTHYQISIAFSGTLDLGWIWPNIEGFNMNFNWLKLDIMDMSRMECIQPINAYDSLFASAIGATFMLVSIPLTASFFLAYQSFSWQRGWSTRTPALVRTRIAFTNRIWNFTIGLLFFFFPPISERAFQTMLCTEMRPGEKYLYSVQRSAPKPRTTPPNSVQSHLSYTALPQSMPSHTTLSRSYPAYHTEPYPHRKPH